jgi:hypothetical protein
MGWILKLVMTLPFQNTLKWVQYRQFLLLRHENGRVSAKASVENADLIYEFGLKTV